MMAARCIWCRVVPAVIITSCLLAISPLGATAQTYDERAVFNEVSLTPRFGSDARSMAMGFTGIASARDASGIELNPATLVRVRRIELRGGFSHLRYENTIDFAQGAVGTNGSGSRDLSHTAISALSVTYPVPTYRGALVVAGSVNRLMSFKRAGEYTLTDIVGPSAMTENAREIESGGLWQYSAAAATDLSARVSVGATVNVIDGGDEFTRDVTFMTDGQVDSVFDDAIEDDYIGFSALLGMTYQASMEWTLGLTVETPTWLDVEERWEYNTYIGDNEYYEPGFFDYNLRHPFRFGAGVEYRGRRFSVTGDVRYTDWSQLEFSSDPPDYGADETAAAQELLRETVEVHLGGELVLPEHGVTLRAGYFYDPLPFESMFIDDDGHYITLGGGVLIDKVMVVDLAFVAGGTKVSHRRTNGAPIYTEQEKTKRLFLTVAYRI